LSAAECRHGLKDQIDNLSQKGLTESFLMVKHYVHASNKKKKKKKKSNKIYLLQKEKKAIKYKIAA
jgi:hypothetical protein